MKSGVYRIYCFKNKKSYIGSSTNISSRIQSHKSLLRRGKHHSLPMQYAYDKYGIDNFYFYIIEMCEHNKLEEIEKHYINFYNSVAPNGFNIESNPKLSRHTFETRTKMSSKRIGENNPFFGKKHSEKTKRKISESRKGKYKVTEDYRKKLRAASACKKLSDKDVRDILHYLKNQIYTAKELAAKYNITRSYIYDLKNHKARKYLHEKS